MVLLELNTNLSYIGPTLSEISHFSSKRKRLIGSDTRKLRREIITREIGGEWYQLKNIRKLENLQKD